MRRLTFKNKKTKQMNIKDFMKYQDQGKNSF